MITPKNVVGSRRLGTLSNSVRLTPKLDKNLLKKWTLTNDNVSFTFIEDPATGVRLESWTPAGGDTVFNKSRNLWQLNTIQKYGVSTSQNTTNFNTCTVYPSSSNFVQPSLFPVQDDYYKTFTFTWNNISYDVIRPEFTCNVTITVRLPQNGDHLSILFSCTANQTYTLSDLEPEESSVVTAIHFPSIIVEKDEDENVNKDFILATPVAVGYVYYNPFKYLRAPRFQEESFQFNHEAERCYAAGFVGYPLPSLIKYNYGSPGGMSIPAIVIGNKSTKNGALIYAMDQDGTNPKGFQWYVDDNNLIIHTYHVSDHMLDPYGIGGYANSTPYSTYNTPSWELRIRPFISETSWIDWKGFEIYKEEAVPEQVDNGWLPDSLYNRAQAGVISKATSEFPLILNMNGFMSGSPDNMISSLNFYKDVYVNSINPGVTTEPYIPIHYQTIGLNYQPNRRTGATDPKAIYDGWYSWAGSGLASIGPEVYKMPDVSVNSGHSGIYVQVLENSGLLYHYDVFPFTISSGAAWTIANSGIDLISKELVQENITFTNDDYKTWAYSGSPAGIYSSSFMACLSPEVNKEKNKFQGAMHASFRAGVYHDTLGIFGRGCFGHKHTYYDGTGLTTITHPRGMFTKYFNDLQVEWMLLENEGRSEALSGLYTDTQINDFNLACGSEYPVDVLLNHTPISAIYEPLGPILNAFFNKITDPRPDAVYNRFSDIDVDKLSDAEVQAYLSLVPGLTHWACLIRFPNWIQRCPAYQIALGDRALFNEWAGVYITNAFDQFFSGQVITGQGTYGQVLGRAKTTGEWAEAWAAYAGASWPFSNRISAWHLDNQIGFIESGLADIENDEATVFARPEWSTLFNSFSKKLFRIQAYNPDYVYHGSLVHPLETWASPGYASNTAIDTLTVIKASITNIEDPYSGHVGIPKVQHTVRKHRDNGNFLIVAGNWHSGLNTFSAQFNPSNYGIENGYQVYSLDVNSPQHGTRTLLSIKSPGEVYSINSSLSQYEYLVYEIEVNSTTLDNLTFSDLKTDYAPIRYSYGVKQIETSNYTIPYSYDSPYFSTEVIPPIVGERASATQQILNNLPQWTKTRQDTDSNGWKLTNSWGMALENVVKNVTAKIGDAYLVTSDFKQLSKLSYVDVDSKELLENVKRNALFNSGFEIKDISITDLPAGWDKHSLDELKINYKDSNISPACLHSPNGQLKISQSIILDNIQINTLYSSVYVKCNAQSVNVKLIISIEKIDGTSIMKQCSLSNRSSEWIRLAMPITVDAQVYRINFIISGNCTGDLYISNPQLERNALTTWTSSINDFKYYLGYTSLFNSVFAVNTETAGTKIPLSAIGDEQEFIEIGIPSRVEKITKPVKNLTPYLSTRLGRRVTFLNEIINTEYTIRDSTIVERSLQNQFDEFARYTLRDLRYYEDLTFGTKEVVKNTIEPVACLTRKDILFIVCKEAFEEKTQYTLKIVRPKVNPNNEGYLEVLADFNLNLNLNTVYGVNQIAEEISDLLISDVDSTYLIISTTNNNRYYYKLYFDYYYFNTLNNRLYTIESYQSSKINII